MPDAGAQAARTPLLLADPDPAYERLLVAADLEIVTAEAAEIVLGRPDLVAGHLARGLKPMWIQSTWAGIRPLIPGARERGIQVTGIKTLFGPLISEYVLSYLLDDVRKTALYAGAQSERCWSSEWPETLQGRRITVVGTGSIGANVAATARHFGMTVRGVSRTGRPGPAFDRVYPRTALADALDKADYVVACLPDTAETEALFDTQAIASMPRRCMFINVGRASTVDHDALMAALAAGRIRKAILDVLPTEPLPANSALWSTPNLTLTPHVAGVSYPKDVVEVFLANLARYRAGEPLKGLIDLDLGY